MSLIDLLGDSAPVIDVVDVGAMWLGEEAVPYRRLLRPGLARVVGFEPVKEECDKLNAMGLAHHRYLPYCIGDGTERDFVITNQSMTSSLYEPNERLLKKFQALNELMVPVKRERVRTRRLDDLAEVGSVDYMKLDVQGAELDVLRGASRLLRGTMVVHAEVEFVPLYVQQPMFGEVDEFMRSHGFMFHSFVSFGGRCFRPFSLGTNAEQFMHQMLWADAVFVKSFLDFRGLEAVQLLKMAVILHEVYESYDLAALALRHYDVKIGTSLWATYCTMLAGTVPAPEPLD